MSNVLSNLWQIISYVGQGIAFTNPALGLKITFFAGKFENAVAAMTSAPSISAVNSLSRVPYRPTMPISCRT
jgi:hypothetical protein